MKQTNKQKNNTFTNKFKPIVLVEKLPLLNETIQH